jgi:hypothetical protein
MKPTKEQLQKIRELLSDAGGAPELRRWIREALKKPLRQRGRPPGDRWEEVDFWLLQQIDQRHAATYRQRSVSAVISEVVSEVWQADKRYGATQEAAVSRLFSRIRPTVIRRKKMKLTLSKPQFEFELGRYVQPRAKGGQARPHIDRNYASGFRPPPFRDPPGRIDPEPPVYQPGSVEYEQQQQDRTEKNSAKTSKI